MKKVLLLALAGVCVFAASAPSYKQWKASGIEAQVIGQRDFGADYKTRYGSNANVIAVQYYDAILLAARKTASIAST